MLLRCLLSVLTLLWWTAGAQADPTSAHLLETLTAKINSYKSYEVVFTVRMDRLPQQEMRGKIVVSGERYRVELNGSEIYFDGKVRQTYTKANNEVVIEKPDPNDNNLLSNPSRFFRFYNTDFYNTYRGKVSVAGRTTEEVIMKPKKANLGYSLIELYISAITGLPVQIVYHMDESESVQVSILQFISNVDISSSTFTFDRAAHPDVEVIDFQ